MYQETIKHLAFIQAQLSDDFIFKKAMSDRIILEAFLKRVLGEECVGTILTIEEDYKLQLLKGGHYITCDLQARDDEGRVFIIENQNYRVKGFLNRLEYQAQLNGVKEYTIEEYPNENHSYEEFPNIYCIWICDRNPFGLENGFLEFTKMCPNTQQSMYGTQRQVVISRDCIDTIYDECLRDFLRFMGNSTKEIALHSNWNMLHLLYRRYEWIKGSKESEESYMLGYDDMMHYRSEGRAVGRDEGRREGRKEGIADTRTKTIKNLAKESKDIDYIARVMEMSKAEVEAILKQTISA